MCGNGPLMEVCRSYVRTNQIKNVDILGFVKQEVVRDIIAKSRYLILPTRVYEGFPMTIVEAFSEGTPVIVPDLGNAGSLVQDGVNGYKYKYGYIDSLVECIKKSLLNSSLGESTYKSYKDSFTDKINNAILEQIYLQIK